MTHTAAIQVALALVERPTNVSRARTMTLPLDMTTLLRVAAGDAVTLSDIETQTSRSQRELQRAAVFFIEQVLLAPDADSFRVLGCVPSADASELRNHMALLMRVFHPDVVGHHGSAPGLDRSVFAERVTQAWEDLKTEGRRADYRVRLERHAKGGGSAVMVSRKPRSSGRTAGTPKRGRRGLKIIPVLRDGWFSGAWPWRRGQ